MNGGHWEDASNTNLPNVTTPIEDKGPVNVVKYAAPNTDISQKMLNRSPEQSLHTS